MADTFVVRSKRPWNPSPFEIFIRTRSTGPDPGTGVEPIVFSGKRVSQVAGKRAIDTRVVLTHV